MVFLLIVIYIAFIGLGVPDSLIGSAWPAIHMEMDIPIEAVSILTLLISGCTVLSSMFSAGILNKLGTAKVTAFSTAMTAAALFGFSVAESFWLMIPLAVILGLGAGAIDSGLNNYVALHFKASHMNFLHCFYGVGVSLSPYLMSQALSDAGWRGGYRYAFYVQSVITLLLIVSVPLWKKTASANQTEDESSVNLTILQMAKKPEVRQVWIIMLATNAIEYACGVWGSTYLVTEKGFQTKHGALALTVYYVGMSVGRFVSGLLSDKISTWKRIGIGAAILAPAIVIMLLPLPGTVTVVGLFLVGLGNGSIYPNMIHLTPHNFGKEVSQSIMGSQIAFAYIGVMLAPPMVSLISKLFGIEVYPVLLAVLYVIMVITLKCFVNRLKKQNKYNANV
ncbi:MAG: MFS transporter [Oscillospiraceae bacterium]|nr:MFS transporter [Oscillospiraceae bacterium]